MFFTDASDKASLLIFALGISIGLFIFFVKLFLNESILRDSFILNTNFFMKRLISYHEIENVDTTISNRGIRLNLTDNTSVVIYCGDIVNAVTVMRLINSKIKSIKR